MSILDTFDDDDEPGIGHERPPKLFHTPSKRYVRHIHCCALTASGRPCHAPAQALIDNRAYCAQHAKKARETA